MKHIDRPRVLAAFSAAARSDVVVLAAGSGFGKSVALRQHLSTLRERGIDYALRADFDVVDVVRALATLIGISEGLPAIVQAATERGLHQYCARWLGERIDECGLAWIALDDVSSAAPDVRAFLGDLLAQPGASRWYVVIREPEDLSFGPLLGDGRLAPTIDGATLAFDLEEILRLAHARGVTLTPDQARELLHGSAGWPVAASLALQSAGNVDFDRHLPAAREALSRYVTDRAYAELRQSDRELLSWGTYTELRPRLLERLGINDAGLSLQRLSRVIPLLGSVGPAFFANDLLMEPFVRAEALLPADVRSKKWGRVGDAHLALGEHGEALRAFVQCGDPQRLISLLRDHGERLNERGFGADLARGLLMIPSDQRRAEPALLLLEATVETERGRKEIAEDLLRRASASNGDVARVASVRLSTELVNRGRHGAVDVLALVALRYPNDPEVQSAFAVALAAAGDLVSLARVVEAGVRAVRHCSDPLVAARAWQRFGVAAHFAGHRTEARIRCEAALEIAAAEGFDGVAARVHSLLYSIAVAEDDDDAMVAEAAKMVAAARRAGLRQIEIAGLTALMVNAAEMGDDAACAEIERDFSGLGPVRGYANALPHATARAISESRRGRFASAAAGLDRIVSEAEEPPDILACADALSALLIAVRDSAEAKARLSELRKHSRRHAIDPRAATSHAVVLLNVVVAILEGRFGQRAAAARSARQAARCAVNKRERALATAAHDLARAEDAREWSRALDGLRNSGQGGYADLFALLAPAQHAVSTAVLTPLEREILFLYAERRQAKEIADLLGRNVETVRTHIRNGMKKLGVSGREALIAFLASLDEFERANTKH